MKQAMPKGRSGQMKPQVQPSRKPGGKTREQMVAAKQPMNKKQNEMVEKNSTQNANMVTLTRAEFDAIMETIGKLAMESGKDSEKPSGQDVRTYSEERQPRFAAPVSNGHQESVNPVGEIPHTHLTLAEKKRLEWKNEMGSSEVGWHNRENLQTRSEPRGRKEQQMIPLKDIDSLAAPLFLTATEKKKLQWKKERAELSALEKFDPWGRSGAGAPIKDPFGNVVNDYSRRQNMPTNVKNSPLAEHGSNFQTINRESHSMSSFPYAPIQKAQSHPERIDAIGSGFVAPNGASMSSFHSGAMAPDENLHVNEKEKKKQDWLNELEKQREEQRQRKLLEKRERREGSQERYYWADQSGVINRAVDRRQAEDISHVQNSSHNQVMREYVRDEGTNWPSAPPPNGVGVREITAPAQQNNDNSTYIRGQNVAVDPVTRAEQEEKRRKYLELQEYNRKLVEEREEKRKEDKARRVMEDLQEEKKYNQTVQVRQLPNLTSNVQPQFTKEIAPMDRQEQERQREESLRYALEAARLEAEREKKLRLLEKLKKGNHDVSHLEAKLKMLHSSPRGTVASHRSNPEINQRTSAPVHVEPQYVPGLGDLPNSAPGYTDTFRKGFVDNLSDTVQREFGTQTEVNILNMQEFNRDSPEVEYRPHAERSNHDAVKKVRVKSAPKQEQKRRQTTTVVSKSPKKTSGQRPIWGYKNTEQKRAVKQSERDAFHSSDRRRQRRIERQNELLDMMAANAEHIPDYRVPTRARSRSHESRAEELPALPSIKEHEPVMSRRGRSRGSSPDPMQSRMIRSSREASPPVPSSRHHSDVNRNVEKYRDLPPIGGDLQTNFVPFVRSSNILDPVHAESPLVMSREPSEIEKARRAYQGVLNPALYGHRMDYGHPPGQMSRELMPNPSLSTNHPPVRQGQILQQLSTLRQALKEKQREMNSMPETLDNYPDKYGVRGRVVAPAYD